MYIFMPTKLKTVRHSGIYAKIGFLIKKFSPILITMQSKQPLQPYLLLVLSQITIGISIVAAKYLLNHQMPIFILLQVRFFIGTLFLIALSQIPWLKPQKNSPRSPMQPSDFILILLQALCAGFFFNILMSSGLKLTSANNAGIITSALPVVITLMSWFFLKEVMTKKKWFCVLLAFIGICVINLSHSAHGNIPGKIWGDMLVLLSLLPESSYYILAKLRHIKLPLITLSIWINVINTIAFIPFALHSWYTQTHTTFNLLDISLLGLLGITSALFYVFWMLGSRGIPTSITSIFTAIVPISTMLIAWAFLNETITLGNLIGMLLVIASILYSARTLAPAKSNLATSSQQTN